MQLGQLYKNFGTSSPEEQAEFMSVYRLKRASDLSSSPTVQKKRSTTSNGASAQKITLSEEEKLLMKMLGLKQKDILAARQTSIVEVESAESEVDLLKDSTFGEGDE
jgi:hypothetical protein